MKKRYRIFLLVSLTLSVSFVMLKNSLDEQDINGLNRDVEAMYKDRLMAANYIYRMNDLLHKKREFYTDAVLSGKEAIETSGLLDELKAVVSLYENTKLTSEEELIFERFKDLADGLYTEGGASHLSFTEAWHKIGRIDKALIDLRLLSDIQVKEASVLKSRSGDVLSRALLAFRLEWVVLVLLALLLISVFRDRVLSPAQMSHVLKN